MATVVLSKPDSDLYHPIASPWHTLILVIIQGTLSYRGWVRALQPHTMDRMTMYGRTIFFEWLMFALVVLGLWLHGTSVFTVVGERWRSWKGVGRDIGIGVLFLVVSIVLTSILGGHAHDGNSRTTFILPHGHNEQMVWIILSITAGFCEEALYRGYLQRQFIALSKNVPAGIVLSAVAFGAAHAYQGVQQALQIAVLGLMGGILAYVCKTVRPGMIAHALQDVIGGFILH